MGAQMVKEVASKTADIAGDGTTTATVLAQAIIGEGLKMVAAGANPMDLKRGIDKAVEIVVEGLGKISKPCDTAETIKNVATISANSDEKMGQIIADAYTSVGHTGAISVETSTQLTDELVIVNGLQYDHGYYSPYFINSDKQKCILENPYILILDRPTCITEFPVISYERKDLTRFEELTTVGFSHGVKKSSEHGSFYYYGLVLEDPFDFKFNSTKGTHVWFGDSGGAVFEDSGKLAGLISAFRMHDLTIVEMSATNLFLYKEWISDTIKQNQDILK
jgi:hypothetical protein